ncbi:MAG: GNAT family N-acetyltransferase [Gaiellaceae bacterium]
MAAARLSIRPLGRDDAVEALPRVLPGPAREARAHAARLRSAAAADPLQVLLALQGGEPVAVAEGAFVASGYHLLAVHAREPRRRREAAAALLERVCALVPGGRVEASAGTGRGAAWLRRLLVERGFEEVREVVRYRRDLRRYRTAAPGPFAYRSFGELGRVAATDLLDAILRAGPVEPHGLDAVDLMDELLFAAAGGGSREPDTSLWRIPHLDGAPAGISFAQTARPRADTGSMAYVGLLPEHCGKGLGRRLHAHALATLRAAGMRSYEDATAAGNHAMRRVFEQNGCEPAGSSLLYVLPPSPGPDRVHDFGGLVALLAERGHPHEVLDEPGRRVWALLRFADVEAPLEIAWRPDERVVEVVQGARGSSIPLDRDGSVRTDTLLHVLRELVWAAPDAGEPMRSLLHAIPVRARAA